MPSTFQTPRGPITVNQWRYMPMNNGYTASSPSIKYPFTLVLKNDSIVQVKGRIDISDKYHFIKGKVKKQRVASKPSDTKEIYHITKAGFKLIGIPADSCWLFKAMQGKISLYSYMAERGSDNIIAIQKGEG